MEKIQSWSKIWYTDSMWKDTWHCRHDGGSLGKLELMHDSKVSNGNESHICTDDARGKQLSISDFFADLSGFTMMKAQIKMAKIKKFKKK